MARNKTMTDDLTGLWYDTRDDYVFEVVGTYEDNLGRTHVETDDREMLLKEFERLVTDGTFTDE